MRGIARGLAVSVCAAILIAGSAGGASAKSYHFTNVDIAINVRPDGSFTVREMRTFAFSGSYHFAFIDIPLGPSQSGADYSVDTVAVSEGRRAFRRVASADTQEPGTFVFTTSDQYEIRWFYAQNNNTRTFTITYTVRNGIQRFDDVAEFYWKFIGDQWTVGTDRARATVTLPAGATRDQVRAWGHGPLEGEVQIVDGRTIVWSTPTLPASTFMEGRVAFPPALVPGAPHVSGQRLPQVLNEEQGLADQANGARSKARLWNLLSPIFALASFGVFLLLFVKYGKEPRAPDPGEYVREPPADYPPAVLGYLLRFGKVKPEDMVATLMDLARKGFIEIREKPEDAGSSSTTPSTATRSRSVRKPTRRSRRSKSTSWIF